ncbi:dipeptidase [Pelagibacterium xiamenense]|uniref:dipeptidase n=1 Tax=Pelagibacterium xiamenense TaxID=2901140 RepID=UPI001E313C1A|nr:dipeptidase [Pelagibacterium xiamenense]MCD7058922.1 dipeptidase [Pelagibacterium xiamenense]
MIPVFDGHNDVALRLFLQREGDPVAAFLDGGGPGHIDLPKARAGGLAGGFFALYVPSAEKLDLTALMGETYDLPLPPPLDREAAQEVVDTELALLKSLAERSGGAVSICTSTRDIRAAHERGALSVIVHLEGADAIDADLTYLETLYNAGLRSLGPVWSRPTIFGHGVPMRFPGSPDTGPGLTDAGKRLVEACNRLGVMIDLSHLNEKGFWDVAALSDAPLVATHSNAHAISPVPRNLTDRQLDAIRESDGIVGLNFATAFLRPDGQMRTDTDLTLIVRHLDFLVERLGETRVGIGSDFDGALIPDAIGSARHLPVLFERLARHGYDAALLEKIAFENWMRVLSRIID